MSTPFGANAACLIIQSVALGNKKATISYSVSVRFQTKFRQCPPPFYEFVCKKYRSR
jgi:hypothetical protein